MSAENPYGAPKEGPAPDRPATPADYDRLPWYRKSNYLSPFVLLGLCCSPSILFVCVVVLTGDVYLNKVDAAGQLKTWGWGNKVAAVIILLLNVGFTIAQVVSAVRNPAAG